MYIFCRFLTNEDLDEFNKLNAVRGIYIHSDMTTYNLDTGSYTFFLDSKAKAYPFVMNTRMYSIIFIRNDIPYRWRGRYNEDTILSLC